MVLIKKVRWPQVPCWARSRLACIPSSWRVEYEEEEEARYGQPQEGLGCNEPFVDVQLKILRFNAFTYSAV